jgi:4-hydroxybenzoate polyprenyltransferase
MSGARGGPGRLRAWLEVLRAPLQLSPVADVLAGWCVAAVAAVTNDSGVLVAAPADLRSMLLPSLASLGLAAGAGVLMLAGGMLLNAVVDVADDRRRKPTRPLPRGALRPAVVAIVAVVLLVLAFVVVTLGVPGAGATVSVMIGLIAVYHLGLKRLRLPGCATLGAIRGLDLLLGVMAWRAVATGHARFLAGINPSPRPGSGLALVAIAYGLYMTGASLHASTDDEPGRSRWSAAGTALSLLALAVVGALLMQALPIGASRASLVACLVLLLAAASRIASAARIGPAPRTTGVLLSGLYLFDAAVCFGGGWGRVSIVAGGVTLGLFVASRLLLRRFPPT